MAAVPSAAETPPPDVEKETAPVTGSRPVSINSYCLVRGSRGGGSRSPPAGEKKFKFQKLLYYLLFYYIGTVTGKHNVVLNISLPPTLSQPKVHRI